MKRLLLLLFSFLFFFPVFSQTKTIVLKGKISSADKKGISYALIRNMDLRTGATSNENGDYLFRTKLPATIKVSALGYRTQTIEVHPSTTDTLEMNFILQRDMVTLKEVSITAEYKPDVITSADNLAAFEMQHDNLWLLYDNRHGMKIRITDTSGTFLSQCPLGVSVEGLHKTEHGFVYSISHDSAYVFQWDTTGFHNFSIPMTVYGPQVLSMAGYLSPFYYQMKESEDHAGIAYTYLDADGKEKVLYRYVNEEVLESNEHVFQSLRELGYIWEGENAGQLSGTPDLSTSPNGTTASMNSRMIALDHARNFTHMLQVVYCPMRIVRDSIYIFNFNADSIYVFDRKNHFARRTFLAFDKTGANYEDKNMLVDEEKQECYFTYVLNGITYLEKIDLNTGTSVAREAFSKYPFVEKMRVSHGYAYFTCYDHSNASGKRYLYRQRLE